MYRNIVIRLKGFKYIAFTLFAFIIITKTSLAADTIRVGEIGEPMECDLLGINATTLYSILEGDHDTLNNRFLDEWLSGRVVQALDSLDIRNFRFPGGTTANYYHFYGDKGYGSSAYELACRPGLINNASMEERLRPDDKFNRNMIEYFVDLVRASNARPGKTYTSGTTYVLNLMTHLFRGDFFPYNNIIRNLILVRTEGIGLESGKKVKDLQPEEVENILTVIESVLAAPEMLTVYNVLNADSGFNHRLKENLDAVEYLMNEGIEVEAIEMGNELFSQLMLYDDDLSEIGFDCTTPDSLRDLTGAELNVFMAIEGIVKYRVLVFAYRSALVQRFVNPGWAVSVLLSPPGKGITFQDDEPLSIITSQEKFMLEKIWNGSLLSWEVPDAFVTHIYMQPFSSCGNLDTTSHELHYRYASLLIEHFLDHSVEEELSSIRERNVHGKPLWVTEWNMNNPSVLANTFLQAAFLGKFMIKIMDLNRTEGAGVERMNYHSLAIQDFNRYALLQSGYYQTDQFQVDTQMMYYAFDHLSSLCSNESLYNFPPESFFPEDSLLPEPFLAMPFLSEDTTQLWVYHINESDVPVKVPLAGRMVQVGNGIPRIIHSLHRNHLVAEAWNATNNGCDGHRGPSGSYPSYFTDVHLGTGPDTLVLPPVSQGISRMELRPSIENPVQTETFAGMLMYPNPVRQGEKVIITGRLNSQVTISSLDGKEMGIPLFFTDQGLVLDTGILPAGLYAIRIRLPQGHVETRKLVVL